MALKFKKNSNFNEEIGELILQIAKAVGKEIAEQISMTGPVSKKVMISIPEDEISIDESIIPVEVSTSEIDASNISKKLETEITVDKDLDKSKNRLAAILRKKK